MLEIKKSYLKIIKLIGGFILGGYIFYIWFSYYQYLAPALYKRFMNSEVKVFEGEIEPDMPNGNEDHLLGVDKNKNGIRDDVDIWINRTGRDYNEIMAMRQYAKNFQKLLNTLKYKNDSIPDAVGSVANSRSCLVAVIEPVRERNFFEKIGIIRAPDFATRIDTLYLNNSDRKKLYSELNNYTLSYTLSGEFLSQCKFNIHNIDEVKKRENEFRRRK